MKLTPLRNLFFKDTNHLIDRKRRTSFMTKNTIFTQLTHFISPFKFQKISEKYGNEKYVKKFNGYTHFKILLLTQIKGFSSLRSIEIGLKSRATRLYHMGINIILRRSTLSDANNNRDPKVLQDVFYHVLGKCKPIAPKHKFRFSNEFYSLDATVISLCLTLCKWAKHRKKKSAVKINTVLNHNGYVPDFLTITAAKHHDIKVSKEKYFQKMVPGSIIAMDRGYIDFKWFHSLNENGTFFITRAKKNMNYKVVERRKILKNKGIIKDHVIKLCGFYMKKDYPGKLRLVKYKDVETGKVYEFLTNNFNFSSRTIADCYKERWQIELFFKWVKQHLKIKKFIGNSEHAIQFQIWTALIYYVILSYLKFKGKWNHTLLEISRVMREKIEDRQSIWNLLEMYRERKIKIKGNPLQNELFNPLLTGH